MKPTGMQRFLQESLEKFRKELIDPATTTQRKNELLNDIKILEKELYDKR